MTKEEPARHDFEVEVEFDTGQHRSRARKTDRWDCVTGTCTRITGIAFMILIGFLITSCRDGLAARTKHRMEEDRRQESEHPVEVWFGQ